LQVGIRNRKMAEAKKGPVEQMVSLLGQKRRKPCRHTSAASWKRKRVYHSKKSMCKRFRTIENAGKGGPALVCLAKNPVSSAREKKNQSGGIGNGG